MSSPTPGRALSRPPPPRAGVARRGLRPRDHATAHRSRRVASRASTCACPTSATTRHDEGRRAAAAGLRVRVLRPRPGWNVTVRREARRPIKPTRASRSPRRSRGLLGPVTASRGRSPRASSWTSAFRWMPDGKPGDKLTFKALQTYDNGEVVRWIGRGCRSAGPDVTLTAAAGEAGGHGGVSASSGAPEARTPRRPRARRRREQRRSRDRRAHPSARSP